jgi:hypothetical protein
MKELGIILFVFACVWWSIKELSWLGRRKRLRGHYRAFLLRQEAKERWKEILNEEQEKRDAQA